MGVKRKYNTETNIVHLGGTCILGQGNRVQNQLCTVLTDPALPSSHVSLLFIGGRFHIDCLINIVAGAIHRIQHRYLSSFKITQSHPGASSCEDEGKYVLFGFSLLSQLSVLFIV